ncbi:MAG: DUF2059 domain-containing protein [bacterium]|nr:DUF2059 domain-containing protein [bacterium]
MRFNLTTTLLSLIVLIIAATPSPHAQSSIDSLYNLVDSTKAAEITELLQLTGAANLGKQFVVVMFQQLRAAMPQVPEDYLLRLESKIDPQEMERMVVPIYDKYFTLEDIREMKAFYSSPVGRKAISLTPQLMQESMVVGQEWSERITAEVMRDLEKMVEQSADSLPKPSEQR